MIDLQDKNSCPTLEEIGEYVKNPIFMQFCSEIKNTYGCSEKMEFSSCSMESGWNVKFKKAGKTLCTIELQDIYHQINEGNGQKWHMSDLEDEDSSYQHLMRLTQICRNC